MNRKGGDNDGEKDDQKNHPDPLGVNVASDQAYQTRKRNQLREWHTGNPLDRVGHLRQLFYLLSMDISDDSELLLIIEMQLRQPHNHTITADINATTKEQSAHRSLF
jgi:hypothetical protein